MLLAGDLVGNAVVKYDSVQSMLPLTWDKSVIWKMLKCCQDLLSPYLGYHISIIFEGGMHHLI